MKIRQFENKNYRAIFTESGKTLHMRYDDSKPMLMLDWPELYDIGLGTLCKANCDFCYISAISNGINYENIVEKATKFFGTMSENQKPFQVAIGGSGEPTLHPDFIPFMAKLRELGIMPNYTTNGMHLNEEIIEGTVKYAGGVALSTHPHLTKVWRKGIKTLTEAGIRTNLHIIIKNREMVDQFLGLRDEYSDLIEYFVLLPYQTIGRAKPEPKLAETYDYLFSQTLGDNVAYGAGFYEELVKRPHVNADLYDHGVLSKYIDMDGNMTLFNSSYEWETPLRTNLLK